MKNRLGFVSNSSSASFIINFQSVLSKDEINKVLKSSDWWLKEQWDVSVDRQVDWDKTDNPMEMQYRDVDIVPIGERFLHSTGKAELGDYGKRWNLRLTTTMFNDWTDLTAWTFIRALHEKKLKGFQLDSIIQIEDEYDEVNREEEFDSYCWEYSGGHDNGQERQDTFETEYLDFLHDVNVELSESESIFLSKKHLLS